MEFVNPKSAECTKSELDIFLVPPTQTSLKSDYGLQCAWMRPDYFLSPGTEDFDHLCNTILMVRAKVTKADGGILDDGSKVGAVNNFLLSLFKQVFFRKEN